MDSLSGIAFFVQAADARSFSEAGRLLGVSSSAVGKSVARLEQHLGVRLLHRSTRSITLTAEGTMFLERCRKILCEAEAAQLELSQSRQTPQGRLKVSLPLVIGLAVPALTAFMQRYPAIELDVDFSDRMVDVIDEGFDAVIRTGEPADSRLLSRPLGRFRMLLVGAPTYFAGRGTPRVPTDLQAHACLQHRLASTGRFELWPLCWPEGEAPPTLPASMVCNTTEHLVHFARNGHGIACVPDFMAREAIAAGELVTVLDDFNHYQGTFRMLWPSAKHAAPKLRVFIDFMSEALFARHA